MKEIITKIKKPFIRFTEFADSKTKPETGAMLYKVFKIISLVMILVGMPAITIGFGIFALGQFPGGYPETPMIATAWTFFTLMLSSLVLWFWFSKFNIKNDEK